MGDKKSSIDDEELSAPKRRGGRGLSNADAKDNQADEKQTESKAEADDKGGKSGGGGFGRRKRSEVITTADASKPQSDGGWMNIVESSSTSHTTRRKSMAVNNPPPEDDEDDEGFDDPKDEPIHAADTNKDKHFQGDDNEEIVLIPDLDEEGGGEDQRIAHAPRNVNRKIPTLKELDAAITSAASNQDPTYNLSILLSTLVPPSVVHEEDVTWTFESLLREITDELTHTPKTVVSVTDTMKDGSPSRIPTKLADKKHK